jgi:hypothetical protein
MLAFACPDMRCTAFTLAPALTAKLAAVCRKSWGVIVGNSGVLASPAVTTSRALCEKRSAHLTTSAANAFSLVRHNCDGDYSARADARRFAGMESPLGAARPRQGAGTPRAPARASIGISDPADSSGRSAIPTTAVTEPTAAARSPAESATGSARPPALLPAVSAGPPAGSAAGSVRPATRATGAGHHSAVHSAAAEGGAGKNPTPLLGQPAVDGSGPGHRAGGRPGRRGRC